VISGGRGAPDAAELAAPQIAVLIDQHLHSPDAVYVGFFAGRVPRPRWPRWRSDGGDPVFALLPGGCYRPSMSISGSARAVRRTPC
jgi:hypothetical protein